MRTACGQGGRFTLATPAAIRALRALFAPLLEADPSLAPIRALVSGLPADVPPDSPSSDFG